MIDERNEYEKYIDDKIQEIKEKLSDYISIEGITTEKSKFSCPNKAGHKHGDLKPGAGLKGGSDGKLFWNCFVCEAGGTIFDFANYHEGLPTRGSEFMTKTIPTLAKKLDIEWKPETVMTEAMKELHKMYKGSELLAEKAVSTLADMYVNKPDHDIVVYAKSRGLTREDLFKFDIGYLELEDAVSTLSRAGVPTGLMNELSVDPLNRMSSWLFSKDGLIFALRNPDDRVVAFASRNIKYGEPGNEASKYINSQNSRIFQKKKFLYGLHLAKGSARQLRNINVFEGYLDVVTSIKHGLHNVAAVCGVAFGEDHAALLHKTDISGVTMCLDGDEAGAGATARTMEKVFSKGKMVTPFIKQIPNGKDPDELLRQEGGLKEFNELRRYNLIEYRVRDTFILAKTNEMDNIDEEIEKFFQWLIEYESNPIKRTHCIKMLSEYTGYDPKDLRKQLEYQDKMMSDEMTKKVDGVWYDLMNQGRSAILRDRISALDSARDQLSSFVGESEGDPINDQVADIEDIDKEYKTSKITQLKTGWKEFDSNVMIPKDSSLIMVGAYPNVGKSILMRDLALSTLLHNPDVGVIYFTLDDPKKQTVPAMIANLMQIQINDIRYQNTLATNKRKEVLAKVDQGFLEMKNLIKTHKLALFDQSDVSTMGDIETKISIVGENMQKHGKFPVVVVDSLHSISMAAGVDRRLDTMSNIRDLRRLANVNHIPIFGVAELRKGNSGNQQNRGYRRPTLRDFSETGDIEYRVTVGIILENELKERKREATKVWYDDNVLKGKPLPILTAHVDKNKEGYFQGELNFKAMPMYSKLVEIPESELDNYRNQPETADDIPKEVPPESSPKPPGNSWGMHN